MNTYTCTRCKQSKEVANFYTDKSRWNDLSSRCKLCMQSLAKERHALNPEKHRKQSLERYYRQRASGQISSTTKRYVLSHVHRNPIALWADISQMIKIYELKAYWNQVFPEEPLSVDHIIPLKNPLVCGLHTSSNIRLILDKDNRVKNNSFYEPEQDIFFITRQVYVYLPQSTAT